MCHVIFGEFTMLVALLDVRVPRPVVPVLVRLVIALLLTPVLVVVLVAREALVAVGPLGFFGIVAAVAATALAASSACPVRRLVFFHSFGVASLGAACQPASSP